MSAKRPVFRPRNANRARELRSGMSPAEARLWSMVSRRQLDGLHFTRQFQIGPYFADFVCRRARRVVELDGFSHDTRLAQDAAKDRQEGFRVLRFLNEDVMTNLEGVLITIKETLADGPSPGPSRKREGSPV